MIKEDKDGNRTVSFRPPIFRVCFILSLAMACLLAFASLVIYLVTM